MVIRAQVRVRHRRCGIRPREGGPHGLAGVPPPSTGGEGHPAEGGSVPERGCGDDEPLRAWRGVRDEGRVGDGPRHRPLRAVPRPGSRRGELPHHGAGVLGRDHPGEERRLPRPHGAGHPPHHRRDQAPHPWRRGCDGGRRGGGRGGGDGGRYRGPPLPRGDPPAARRAPALRRGGDPPLLPPDPLHHAGAEDEANPALGEGAPHSGDPTRFYRRAVSDRGSG